MDNPNILLLPEHETFTLSVVMLGEMFLIQRKNFKLRPSIST